MRKVIDIKVGYTCNNDCVHCAIAHMKQDIIESGAQIDRSFDQIKALIDQNRNVDMFTVTGGEPTARKDFIQIIEYINSVCKPDAVIQVQTNGRRLTKFDLSKLKNNIIFTIAVHGDTAELHDKITRSKHSFDQTIQGIQYVLQQHHHVVIKIVINKFNCTRLLQIVQFLKTINVHFINIAFPHGIGAAWENDIVPTYEQTLPSLLSALDFCDLNGIDVDVVPFCMLQRHMDKSSAIKTNNLWVDVIPIKMNQYNWNKAHDDEIYKQKNVCDKCDLNCICEGVWQDYINRYHNVKNLTPITLHSKIKTINRNTLKLLSLI